MKWMLFSLAAVTLIVISPALPGAVSLISAGIGGYMVGHMAVELNKRDRK